ncbi:MAG: V-type ATPase subunit [Chloroflexi bacterium]|nr:V-type ATPase subunit [Chloroflexota bacterium]
MDTDYDYPNARLRAMKSRLLTRAQYAELLEAANVEAVVAQLAHTAYQDAINAALVKASGWDCLSQALRRDFADTLARITTFFRDTPQHLWKILIARWEIFNIKTILRGQQHHIPADQVLAALIPAGDLRESDFHRLAQQTSVRAVVDLLATWNHACARALLDAMPRYAEHTDLAELELALDRARYNIAFKELAPLDDANAEIVRAVLRDEIDATNILTTLRLSAASSARLVERYGNASPAPLLIAGGGSAAQFLIAQKEIPSVEQIARALRDTLFGDALARAATRYETTRALAAFEDELETQLARQQIAFFKRDPLSIGIAIAYLAARVNEIRNLRVIGRGKAGEWTRDAIEKELLLWHD